MHSKDVLGRYGEELAVRCLTDAGFSVLERNWRCARGEIDIVAVEGRTLIFCEVKTRSSTAFGDPAEAVGWIKSQRLRSLGLHWLGAHPGNWDAIRFDVLSVLRRRDQPAAIRHIRGAL